MNLPFIAAVVLTLNEQRHIGDCLDTLTWTDARVVFDSYSSDATCDIARARGTTVTQNKFENYAQQRNAALSYVQSTIQNPQSKMLTWVFFIDADERCTDALANEIRAVAETDAHAVWAVPRDNYLFGKLTRGAGWYPDHQARLFLVGRAAFDPLREVHEVAKFDGTMGYLTNTLTHYNYDTVEQFHIKQRKYTDYDASILFKQGVRPKPQNFILQPLREFRRRFFSLRGYQDGLHGLRLSALMAYYNLQMYLRLRDKWRDAR
jgi:glycosyltransferase involved in cell wall biosynthesis